MKVRITKGNGWYTDKVGEVFEVVDTEYNECLGDDVMYFVDPPSLAGTHGQRYVRRSDCEIVGDGETEADAVSHPSHYTTGKFETIEMIEEITKGYDDGFVAHCVGTAVKYLSRAPFKHDDPTEDIGKARQYLTFAIDHLTEEDE